MTDEERLALTSCVLATEALIRIGLSAGVREEVLERQVALARAVLRREQMWYTGAVGTSTNGGSVA